MYLNRQSVLRQDSWFVHVSKLSKDISLVELSFRHTGTLEVDHCNDLTVTDDVREKIVNPISSKLCLDCSAISIQISVICVIWKLLWRHSAPVDIQHWVLFLKPSYQTIQRWVSSLKPADQQIQPWVSFLKLADQPTHIWVSYPKLTEQPIGWVKYFLTHIAVHLVICPAVFTLYFVWRWTSTLEDISSTATYRECQNARTSTWRDDLCTWST
jgi:hypothetical protein